MGAVGGGGGVSVGGRCGCGAEQPEDAGDEHREAAERWQRRQGQEGTPLALSRQGEHRCFRSTGAVLPSLRSSVRVPGAALSPLLPAPPQLNVHLGSKSKPGSSAAVFLFLFGHVG